MKLITKPIAEALIAAYKHSAETGESGKNVVAKYFTPWANATWYISEGMPVDADGAPCPDEAALVNYAFYDWHLYGYCDLGMGPGCSELGYVMLSDLHALKGPAGLTVERDLHYSGTMADVLKKYGEAA